MVSLYAVRDHEHRKAVHGLEKMHFNLLAPQRVSAYPYFWHVFRWYAVAETNNFFAASDIDSRTGKLDMSQLRFYHKQSETAETLAAKRSYAGRVYLDWAQYPLVTESHFGDNTVVYFKDLRFDYPMMRGGRTLSLTVELNPDFHVVEEVMGERRQQPPVD